MIDIQGIICAVGMPSLDKRVVDDADWCRDEDHPVYYLPPHGWLGVSETQIHIGRIRVVGVMDGLVFAKGWAEMWPEDNVPLLGCGVDLNMAEAKEQDGFLHVVGGKFCGLAVYSSGDTMRNAWPFAQIWRVP